MSKTHIWKHGAIGLLGASTLCMTVGMATAGPVEDPLRDGFQAPPQEARPHLWWHWMGGNITAEGARLDLDWMRRIGIGGVHAFSGGKLPTPTVVKPLKPFMSAPWQEIFRQSVTQAHTSGLEFTIAASPGWSETGGPWVQPADGMKKYVWSETVITGGRRFNGKLSRPPSVTGPFLDVGDDKSAAESYGDTAVIAFPTPKAEHTNAQPIWKRVAKQGTPFAIESPVGIGTPLKLSLDNLSDAVLEATYTYPVRIGAVTIGIREDAQAALEVDQGGGRWTTVVNSRIEAASDQLIHPAPQETIAFAPVTASRFRLRLKPIAPASQTPVSKLMPKPRTGALTITQLQLQPGGRINGYEAKAGFQSTIPEDVGPSAAVGKVDAIKPAQVIDLTGRLRSDGSLDWTPPSGKWTVLRFGWSLTGAVNAPAEKSATGLEVDKLDASAVTRYLDHYLGLYDQASGNRMGPAGVQAMLTDSWEAGVQNWTPDILAAFKARRGYDATPYLAVLSGRVVGSSDMSEAFLFDFRQTLKDLVADNHHAVLARALHARGMQYYSEAQGDFPRAIADGMTLKARADIPTAEYWYRPFSTAPGQPPLQADLKEAASAAHVYGKPYAAAEALTVAAVSDPWAFSPAMLRPVADEIFASGINRLLLHESHHQPLVDAKPGLALFIFGQYFNRNDTWAEQAGPWITYLSRTSYLLQQGRYAADIAYFYGEERSLSEQFVNRLNTDLPSGFGYDYINPEALLTLLSVRDGQIVTPSGMAYRFLYIPEHITRLTLPALTKIRDLVGNGAILVARRPVGGLGLGSRNAAIERIANQLWGRSDQGAMRWGKGRVYTNIDAALAGEHLAPDVTFKGQQPMAAMRWLHRKLDGADIYFISNQSEKAQDLWASFRVDGRAPELWKADTGSIEAMSFRRADGRTSARLKLEGHEAGFVVFRNPTDRMAWIAPERTRTQLSALSGPWQIHLEPKRGAPATATFDKLTSWTNVSDDGIKYFSGSARYEQMVSVDRNWLRTGRRLELDLGAVHELATVTVNGVPFQTLWHAPYRVDISKALKPGRNRIAIDVVNLWPNRLIGDKQMGATPVAFAPSSPYRANSPLLPSGLLGPVRIMALDEQGPSPQTQTADLHGK